jgi:transcriptional regulator with XRE-family HTH domain
MSFSERIKEIMLYKGWNQTIFAKETGIAKTTLASMLARDSVPKLDSVQSISLKMPEIRLKWLVHGDGSMLMNADERKSVQRECCEELENAQEEIIKLRGQVALLRDMLGK